MDNEKQINRVALKMYPADFMSGKTLPAEWYRLSKGKVDFEAGQVSFYLPLSYDALIMVTEWLKHPELMPTLWGEDDCRGSYRLDDVIFDYMFLYHNGIQYLPPEVFMKGNFKFSEEIKWERQDLIVGFNSHTDWNTQLISGTTSVGLQTYKIELTPHSLLPMLFTCSMGFDRKEWRDSAHEMFEFENKNRIDLILTGSRDKEFISLKLSDCEIHGYEKDKDFGYYRGVRNNLGCYGQSIAESQLIIENNNLLGAEYSPLNALLSQQSSISYFDKGMDIPFEL